METKEENTRRIRELEEEFADEKIAEFFPADGYYRKTGRLRGRRARIAALRAALIAAIAVLCVVAAAQFFALRIMRDDSMGSTIEKMDCIIAEKHAYDAAGPGFGDLVLYVSGMPDGKGGARELTGRVIGLPGDEVEIKAWGVYRNGGLLDEPYLESGGDDVIGGDGGAGGELASVTVPEGSCFVLGDNRAAAVDSRDVMVGFVPQADLRGKVVFRLLPVSRAGSVG